MSKSNSSSEESKTSLDSVNKVMDSQVRLLKKLAVIAAKSTALGSDGQSESLTLPVKGTRTKSLRE